MNINGTLLVQILHFLVALWVLRTFLFKPIVRLIAQEDAERFVLNNFIAQESLKVMEKQQEFNELLLSTQATFAQEIPIQKRFTRTNTVITSPIPEYSQKNFEEITHQVTQTIVNQLAQVPE